MWCLLAMGCVGVAAAASVPSATCGRSGAMDVKRVATAGTSHPFGDERSVRQAFPSAIPAEEADPFLMCDNYAFPTPPGATFGEDEFPVEWHPHRGMDILSYLKTGVGRHGDSLGNRETFETPGLQWISCGSGVEHAEGGGGAAGGVRKGFQIWINTPAARKMDDPRYGTHPPDDIPLLAPVGGGACRLLAGDLALANGSTVAGPFRTAATVQMIDWELRAGDANHELPPDCDTSLLYVYSGGGTVNGRRVAEQDVVQFDASDPGKRSVDFATDAHLHAVLFSGKRLDEPIAWRGPIVMNTQAQLAQTFRELRAGTFPPVRVPWDYKRAAARPPPRA